MGFLSPGTKLSVRNNGVSVKRALTVLLKRYSNWNEIKYVPAWTDQLGSLRRNVSERPKHVNPKQTFCILGHFCLNFRVNRLYQSKDTEQAIDFGSVKAYKKGRSHSPSLHASLRTAFAQLPNNESAGPKRYFKFFTNCFEHTEKSHATFILQLNDELCRNCIPAKELLQISENLFTQYKRKTFENSVFYEQNAILSAHKCNPS